MCNAWWHPDMNVKWDIRTNECGWQDGPCPVGGERLTCGLPPHQGHVHAALEAKR